MKIVVCEFVGSLVVVELVVGVVLVVSGCSVASSLNAWLVSSDVAPAVGAASDPVASAAALSATHASAREDAFEQRKLDTARA